MPAAAIDVVPIFLPANPLARSPRRPQRIGFIAREFAAKGGFTLLKAFERVRAVRPDAQL